MSTSTFLISPHAAVYDGFLAAAAKNAELKPHEALSGIFGSVSLAAWIFLLIPQLIENYKQGSAEGISLPFLVIWFIGDVTNFFGAVWAGLVPTVIALAVYFCFADLVLITQCLYYNFVNARKSSISTARESRQESAISDDPEQPLLGRRASDNLGLPGSHRRRSSARSTGSRRHHRGSHAPNLRRDSLSSILEEKETSAKLWTRNALSVLLICAAGAGGWFVAWKGGVWSPTPDEGKGGSGEDIVLGAQILGYFSALCYLGARIPQIIKNYRDKSCEGLSLLFFILSLLGNATYGAGILFHSTEKEYFITNLPWLIGSLGTMIEDIMIFIQFRIYSSDTNAPESAIQ